MVTESDVRQMLTPKENEALTATLAARDRARPIRPEPDEYYWIVRSFSWSTSPQGELYWLRICNRLRDVLRAVDKLKRKHTVN